MFICVVRRWARRTCSHLWAKLINFSIGYTVDKFTWCTYVHIEVPLHTYMHAHSYIRLYKYFHSDVAAAVLSAAVAFAVRLAC